jgi:LPS-assembly protein
MRRPFPHAVLLLFLTLLWPLAAPAQERAVLVSDDLRIEADSRLIATGRVEVLYRGTRLRAQAIIFDRAADTLSITGPIVLTDAEGTLILAEQAQLRADLTEGILTSARMVLDRQLQLAASELQRIGGRYTQLSNTVASSCRICEGDPTPLWEIRARRVIHDQVERQLYFEDAQFRLGGLPVFWIPRLRVPDPTLDRTTGFLSPSLRTTSALGPGIKVPYFIALGPSRDLTLAPYVTTRDSQTLEFRYRQAFVTGGMEFNGAITRDRLEDGTRGYLFATGGFALPQDFGLFFNIETTSDPAYLLDYGITDRDRLDSRVVISRTRRNEFIEGRIVYFNSLRAGDVNSELPSLVGDATFHRRFSGGPLGGEGGFRLQTHTHRRTSDGLTDSDGDGISDGRDVSRASFRMDWRRAWQTEAGVELALAAEGAADIYNITEDPAVEGRTTRLHGAVAAELRWPWIRRGPAATQVIEPVVQLVLAPRSLTDIPNEDSVLVEFDEGNLFALDRFPGSDAVELGARANVGLTWTRIASDGSTVALVLGRVLREQDRDQFGRASGLDGKASDWLVAGHWTGPDGMSLVTRTLLGDDLDITKSESRIDLQRDRYGVTASYVWVVADPFENRADPTSELVFDTRYAFASGWTGKFRGSYDFAAQQGTIAGLGLEYRNECIVVDLSLARRFTSTDDVRRSTDIGLQVDLVGFGSGTAAGATRVCRR